MTRLRGAAAGLILLLCAVPATGQEWRLGTQFGRLTWEGAAPETAGQTSLAVSLSRSRYNEWAGASIGTPLSDGTFWATAATAKRIAMDARIGLGLDLSTHAFLQRVAVPTAAPPPLGLPGARADDYEFAGGGSAQTMGVAFARLHDARLEVRGGLAGNAVVTREASSQDQVAVADGRLLLQLGPVQAGPEAQHWHRRATYAGGTVQLGFGRFLGWGSAGRWTHGGPEDVSWMVGGALGLPAGLRLEASYRGNAFDPLWRQATGSSAAVGASVRLGGGSRLAPPVPATYRGGEAVIRLRARDARGTLNGGGDAPRIAGDFTDWKPVPMQPAADGWSITLTLAPGVYHYAFVTADGEWFVPERTPGRRDDGMGGWVAVLVVSA